MHAPARDWVQVWLKTLLGFVLLMVLIGGITRITGSGLSITEWRPVTGAIPPLSETAWQQEFQKYQAIPQFELVNPNMTLEGFKRIFFWEWLHRLLGRLIGLMAIVPWVVFIWRKKITGRERFETAMVWILGGLQGAVGWFMVSSGLQDRLYVSELRLAIHLFTALLIVAWIQSLILKRTVSAAQVLPKYVWAVFGLFLLQVFYGALTAGLKAGYSYSTFPLMAGAWIPDGLWSADLLWASFLQHIPLVQWIHRWLAVLVAVGVAALSYQVLKKSDSSAARWAYRLVSLQFILGVLTLVYEVPVFFGALHQLNAFFLFMALWALVWHSRRTPV